jgi:homoserine O-succinyltransferase/O-acetyltransferase
MPRPSRPLRIAFIDMNAGVENQAMRCLRSVVDHFERRVLRENPRLEIQITQVSPRDKTEPPPPGYDLYVGTGGPGSPLEGPGTRWFDEFCGFVDEVLDEHRAGRPGARSLFAICYSFELVTMHLGLAEVQPRDARKFGVMPVYTTSAGQDHPLLAPFGDRLFAYEHRNWEVVDLDEARLGLLGGELLARESRQGRVDKGTAALAFHTGTGLEAVQFHPEADLLGILHWLDQPVHAAAFRDAYGEETFLRMMKTIRDPERVARTHAELIPGWMQRRFNALAPLYGWRPIPRLGDAPPISLGADPLA